MVRVPKRASKRQSTKQRVKVQKKVREHHRKQRRDAKKNPEWRSKKKADPGIPNSFPFKEQLLDEIHMKREREEQRRIEERERKIAERKGKKSLIGDDAEDDEEEEDDSDDGDEEQEVEDEASGPSSRRPIAAAQYSNSLDDLLSDAEISDVVFCLDARDPSAWRLPQVEASAKAKGKRVHLAVTRADLVPLESLASHLHSLSRSASPSPVVYPISAHEVESLQPLVKKLQGNKKFAGVAVLGLEHSGRSTLATMVLNLLEGGKVFDTPHLVASLKAGVSEEDEDDEDEEMKEDGEEDVGSASSSDLKSFTRRRAAGLRALLRNKGQVHRAKDVLPLIWALLPLVSQTEDLMMLYNIPAFGSYRPSAPPLDATPEEAAAHLVGETHRKTLKDTEEFLIGLARVQGRAKKHGIPDIYAAARIILRDWCSGSIGYYSMASGWTALPKATRSEIVTKYAPQLAKIAPPRKEWKKDFVEIQKTRRDLHPSPAIGELRLKAAGQETVSIGHAEAVVDEYLYEFWTPRPVAPVLDDDDDEDDDDDDEDVDFADLAEQGYTIDEDQDSDEELDSDALVPDSDEEDEDDDEEDE